MKKYLLIVFFYCFWGKLFSQNICNTTISANGFIENKGQIIDQNNLPNKNVLYLYNGNGLHVQLKQNSFSYEVIKLETKPKTFTKTNEQSIPHKLDADSLDYTFNFHRIDISFIGSNTNPTIVASDVASDYINYYTTGTNEAGTTFVHHYKKVLYQNIYANIDVEFILGDDKNCGGFKYNFIVRPGGNVADIKLKFDGANSVSLTEAKNILIETDYGNIEEQIPHSYQLPSTGSGSAAVQASFKQTNQNIFGVDVKNFDVSKVLIIDPAPWATYFGGSGNDWAEDIGKDTSGNLLITGMTMSSSAIASTGAFRTIWNGGNYALIKADVFIAKFNATGSRLWSTYYGGNDDDWGMSIVTEINGNILVTGTTLSDTGIATTGSYQSYRGAGQAYFVAKFNSAGQRLWGTYYGDGASNAGINNGIAVDLSGNVFITGGTLLSTGIATSGAFDTIYSGGVDAFIAKFNSAGTSLLWGTYYGGTGFDQGNGVATDRFGNISVTGHTTSATDIATTGAFKTTAGGNWDAFIVRFGPTGNRLWGTYYGGALADVGKDIITDYNYNICVTGWTQSSTGMAAFNTDTTSILIYQSTLGGGTDAFIVKFDTAGNRLWGTYYGGAAYDAGWGITVDKNNNMLFTGRTFSISGIASPGAYKTVLLASSDCFFAKFTSGGTRIYATYYGDSTVGYSIVTSDSNIYITGAVRANTYIATTGAYQTIFGGQGIYNWIGGDAYIVCFTSSGVMSGTMPVTFLNISAKKINENILVSWQTASEQNCRNFSVERSLDGKFFENIGSISASGNSNTEKNYQFIDDKLSSFDSHLSTVFYRLKIIDFDASFEYSKIVSVNFVGDENILVYPNPASNFLTIEQKTQADLKIINTEGKTVRTLHLEKGKQIINIAELPQGLYILQLQSEEKVYHTKFVKE